MQPARAQDRSAIVRVLAGAWRLAVDRSYRSAIWLRVTGKDVFQPSGRTYENRYPAIFGFVRSELGVERDAKLLSFGCSTGEEVFWLRKYFPRAAIKGIDINAGSIAVCRRRAQGAGDERISFAVADSAGAEAAESYDAVFCMAVLRDGRLSRPGVTRCDPFLRFDDFARIVEGFARCLKPGGLLVIRHSNFRLCDAPAGAGFQTVFRLRDTTGRSPIFGPDNRLVAGAEYPDTVFRKRA